MLHDPASRGWVVCAPNPKAAARKFCTHKLDAKDGDTITHTALLPVSWEEYVEIESDFPCYMSKFTFSGIEYIVEALTGPQCPVGILPVRFD